MNFTDRCAIAAACLPKADYRAKLEALHAEMLAALAVQAPPHEPDNAPVAWQWLKSGTFRVNLPRTAEPGAWRQLYAAPPQLQPVAWMWENTKTDGRGVYFEDPSRFFDIASAGDYEWCPLYAATGDAA